jgi:hypothetical protein
LRKTVDTSIARRTVTLLASLFLCGCAAMGAPSASPSVRLPLLTGWFDGRPVLYVTTDVSDASLARVKAANYAPVLGNAIPGEAGRAAGQRSSTARVYAIVNHDQGSVFGSAPDPVGYESRSDAYSPLWQLVKVAWRDAGVARVLHTEEEILAAESDGLVTIETTRVVLNCPIVQRDSHRLPGSSTDAP